MQLALLTPQFAPNLFDLASMLKADRIVFTDVEKWSRKGRTHRAEILGEQGKQWINLPILSEDRKKAIKDVRLDHSQRWFDPLWNAIAHNYKEATWFDYFEDELLADLKYAEECEYLLEFNLYFFDRMCRYLEIELHYELGSKVEGYSTYPDEFAANIGADVVFLEHESKNYQRPSRQYEIALTDKQHPIYPQCYNGFEKGCSVLDLMLNVGPECFKLLDQLTEPTPQ